MIEVFTQTYKYIHTHVNTTFTCTTTLLSLFMSFLPVRCLSCNRVVGHLWEKYHIMCQKNDNRGQVLDQMGIVNDCCRICFLTSVDIVTYTSDYMNSQKQIENTPTIYVKPPSRQPRTYLAR
jgi:DNA-directed RNA polymerase I, II, and III subunit RPABC5